jgi:hypothetical protein
VQDHMGASLIIGVEPSASKAQVRLAANIVLAKAFRGTARTFLFGRQKKKPSFH